MKIAYNLSVADWVNFQEYYQKKKAPITGCLVPAIYILTFLNVIGGAWHYTTYGLSMYSVICLICVGVFIFLGYTRNKAKKNLFATGEAIAEKSPGAFGNITMDFTNEGIDIVTSTNTKSLLWSDVDKFEKNKNYFFIYSKKGYVYIIPTRDISETTELEAILIMNIS
ncbi:hypothetical protein M2138_001586 [Dysgonomonadaceae bacterium PH5-43]|nr:hypothetical protein [Dysgonomonadaceae bacterium PH5-43]